MKTLRLGWQPALLPVIDLEGLGWLPYFILPALVPAPSPPSGS